jgi:hypothetical protein
MIEYEYKVLPFYHTMKTANTTKTRITVTVLPILNNMLETVSKRLKTSKSLLVENALELYFQKQLEKDAKSLSKINIEDLPTEDEWLTLQPNWN